MLKISQRVRIILKSNACTFRKPFQKKSFLVQWFFSKGLIARRMGVCRQSTEQYLVIQVYTMYMECALTATKSDRNIGLHRCNYR